MSNNRKRLEALTADLTSLPNLAGTPPEAEEARFPATAGGEAMETRFPPIVPGVAAPRTAPGQMVAFRSHMLAAEGELSTLRERLQQFDGSLPTRKLDAEKIVPSSWANRHDSSFSTAQFAGLKADIEHAGGNVQPIVVRPKEGSDGVYEIVFGHRRHRACQELGIPVLASIWAETLSNAELFAAMDRENRERADLSPYEQGTMYQRALDEQLYPSQRRLAEALGVSHTWVRKAISVAQLPQLVIDAFKSPLEVQHKHADKINAALETDRRAVLKRAERLRGQGASASVVVSQLVGAKLEHRPAGPRELKAKGQSIGTWSINQTGALTLKLDADVVAGDRLEAVLAAVSQVLSQSNTNA